jgi:hypothetical protein
MKRNEKEKIGKFILERAEMDIRTQQRRSMRKRSWFLPYERTAMECLAAYAKASRDEATLIRGMKAAYWIGSNDEMHNTAGVYYLQVTKETKKRRKGREKHVLRERPRRKNPGA